MHPITINPRFFSFRTSMYFWRMEIVLILWNRTWLMWEGGGQSKLLTWQVGRRGLPGIVTGATWKPLWLLLYIANYWLHSFTVSSGVLCDSSCKQSSSRTQDFGFAQLVCRLCSYYLCLWSYLSFSYFCLCLLKITFQSFNPSLGMTKRMELVVLLWNKSR